MKEVRSKGQLSRSQDLTAWVGVGAAAVMIPSTVDRASSAATDQLFSIRRDHRRTRTRPRPSRRWRTGSAAIAGIVGPMLIVVFIVVLAGSAAQGGVHFKKFKVEFEHFNLLSGAQADLRRARRSGAG